LNESIGDRGSWVAVSIGIAVFSSVMLAYLEQNDQRAPLDKKWWYFLRNPWFHNILRFFYAVSIPSIALFSGLLTYRGLGFKPLPWSPAVAQNGAIWLMWQHDTETAFVVIVTTWIIMAYGLRTLGKHRGIYQRPGDATSFVLAVRESIIDQIHWAFYRELCIIIWGIARGSWVVIVPLSIELSLNPATWTRIKHERGTTSLIIKCGILFASTILFIQTQNLWLMLIMEFVLRVLFAWAITQHSNYRVN